jgi:hypothetical protein
MMNARTRLVEQLRPGTKLTCLKNTAVPRRDGAEQVVIAPAHPDGSVPCRTSNGLSILLNLPAGRKGLEWIDDHTVRWPLARAGRLAKHTVTWRIEGA